MPLPSPVVRGDADLAPFLVTPDSAIREVLAAIDCNGEGVALVVDGDRRLIGIVTDGDIRRAILARFEFEQPIQALLDWKSGGGGSPQPLTAPAHTAAEDQLRLMMVRLVRHLPLVDGDGRVCGLSLIDRLHLEAELDVRGVVMAGGFGKRLRPMTHANPKPMLKVGNKPMIEHVLGKLKDSGVRKISVTTHYLDDRIRDHLGNGSGLGLDVQYAHEDKPLGTAGGLAMLDGGGEPLLVVNGDILTAVDYRALLAFHREQGADLTVGVRQHRVTVPFGVVHADGPKVAGITEKQADLFVNAGIYLLEDRVRSYIPRGERFDMTDLIDVLIANRRSVCCFPIYESWVDIGDVETYARAQSSA